MKKLLFLLFTLLMQGFFNKGMAQCTTCPSPIQPDSIVKFYTKLPFHPKADTIWVAVHDSLLIYEGDIIIGKTSELFDTIENAERSIYCDNCALWTNSTIPYVIGSGFSTQMLGQINFAIDYLNKSTNLCVIPRTTESNYVKFFPDNSCWSWLGMKGGEQNIQLNDISDNNGCWYGSIAHEILHAAGFWHEQSREDRDNFIDIFWNNIDPNNQYNFDKHISDGQDIGNYDYLSIMHYDAYAFSINGQPTIKRKNGATDLIGNRNYISGTDIEAINLLYDSKCGLCLDRKMKISPQSMTHNNIGHWEIDGALSFQDNTPFATNSTSRAEFDSGTSIDINPTSTNSAPFEAASGSVVEMYIEGCPGNASTWYSLQALNVPNKFLRHFDYYARIDEIGAAPAPADATFKIVNGFDAGCVDCVAFESKNFPNHFLTVENDRLKVVLNNSVTGFAQKATFRFRSGLATASGISIESWFAPGFYARHKDSTIYIEAYQNDRQFREDATFRLRVGLN